MKKPILFILLAVTFAATAFTLRPVNYLSFKNQNRVPNLGLATHQADATANAKTKIQIALLMDTSNSMDGLIEQAKSQVWTIVNELAKAKKDTTDIQVEFALFQYGNSNLSLRSGYVQQILAFTKDLDALSEKLFALRTGGGSEYCGHVIKSSLDQLDWDSDSNSLRLIYIAGNEPFTQGPTPYKESCSKANEMGVTINTIFCGNYDEGVSTEWANGAKCSNGNYLNINSDARIVQVSTPYDDQINTLNVQLNTTYIHYGKQGQKYKSNQLKQDKNASKYSKANNAKRTISKSNKIYYNGSWDLVDAFNNDTTIVTKLDKKTLPDSIQTFSNAQLQTFIVSNQEKRKSINNDINTLALKRQKYINEQKSGSSNASSLGSSMIKTIRKQAGNKGYTFN